MINIFSKEFWKFWGRMAPDLAILTILFSLVWLLLNGFDNTNEYEEQYYSVIN